MFFRKASANPLNFTFEIRPLKQTLSLKNILGLIRLGGTVLVFLVFFNLNAGTVILKKQFTLFWDQEKGEVTLSVSQVLVLL